MQRRYSTRPYASQFLLSCLRAGLRCAPHLYPVLLLAFMGCRDVSIPDLCRQKISPRLINELSSASAAERSYRVVITLTDSIGVKNAVPTLSVAGPSVATGLLTAAEIRKLCSLNQVRFIDFSKQYHPLNPN